MFFVFSFLFNQVFSIVYKHIINPPVMSSSFGKPIAGYRWHDMRKACCCASKAHPSTLFHWCPTPAKKAQAPTSSRSSKETAPRKLPDPGVDSHAPNTRRSMVTRPQNACWKPNKKWSNSDGITFEPDLQGEDHQEGIALVSVLAEYLRQWIPPKFRAFSGFQVGANHWLKPGAGVEPEG